MGAVYLAHDTQLDRPVALKVPTFGPGEEGLRERFFREARAAAALRHPNLCPVFDLGEQGGVPYLTMAYIEGQSLSAYLRSKERLPPREAVRLVRALAEALQEAHDHGIIHRDLKPSNILLNDRRQPVVTDFGLARRTASQDERLTRTGAIMGTPAYMPPEQVNGDVAAMGPGCDIYALGVILYELLAGRPPFEGPMGVLIARIVLDPPPSLTGLRPDLDPALEAICFKALAKQPEDRYPSMRAFARALESWLDGKAPPPLPVSRRPVTMNQELEALAAGAETVALPRRSRKRTALWFLAAALIFSVTCLLPVGWVVVLLTRFFENVSARVIQAGKNLQEQQKEQELRRKEQEKEQRDLEDLVRTWKPPQVGADTTLLFPPAFGGYRRTETNDKAGVAELDLEAPGWRAVYRGPEGTVELFAYRADKNAKRGILQQVLDAVTRREAAPGFPIQAPGSASVQGSAQGIYLSYDLGSKGAGAGQHGTFLWQGDWLLLARAASAREPGAFLKQYLTQPKKGDP
jgi:hypothetical protein